MGDKAKVKLVTFEVKEFEDPKYQPTPEELQKQFEKYKNVDPGMGDDGYGYRLPEEVQIEYIRVDADKLSKPGKIDDEEAEKYWRDNKEKFTKPKPPTTQPSTAPAEVYTNYTEAREVVRKELAKQQAKQEALRIATEMVKTLSAPWANAPATQPGFKQPPESAIFPDPYAPLVDRLIEKYGKDVIFFERTSFLNRQELSSHQPEWAGPDEPRPQVSLSTATALQGSRESIPLLTAAFLVPQIEQSKMVKDRYSRWFHNFYETVPEPFVDSDGNVYVFRTLGARPKRVAENWQAVKNDQVRMDLKNAHAAKLAEASAQQLTERAKQVGLEAAVKEDPALLAKLAKPPATQPGQAPLPPPDPVKTPAPFARKEPYSPVSLAPARVPEVGYDRKGGFVDKVFAMAAKTATQPCKVALYTEETNKRWIVVQLLEIQPMTQDEFASERRMAEFLLNNELVLKFADAWLDGKNIRARVNYVPKHPEEDNREDREGM